MVRHSVSVVVAAYNEGRDLIVALERILVQLAASERLDFELIVVDDGSSDETPQVLEKFSASRPGELRVLTHEVNQGLVAAMRTGCAGATKSTVVYLDADLSYAPSIVERLVEAKAATGAAVAIASPYMPGGVVAQVPLDRLVASRAANWLLSRCCSGRFSTFTGMVRAYDTATLRDLFALEPVGEFNTWALAALIESGREIVEIPAELIWPAERYAAAPRLSAGKLLARTREVVATFEYLSAACRRGRNLNTGTLVLPGQPTRPYIS